MPVPFVIKDRREGDIVAMYANASLAFDELGWKTKYTLEQMCMLIINEIILNKKPQNFIILLHEISNSNKNNELIFRRRFLEMANP